MKLYFVESMTVPRSGRDPRQFTVQLDIGDPDGPDQEALLSDMLAPPLTSGQSSGGGHTYCEYLSKDTGNRTTKPYFDRDEYFDTEPTPGQLAAARLEVGQRMDRIVSAITNMVAASGGAEGANPVTYNVATRHGWVGEKKRYKLSFRPFVSGVRVRCNDIPLLLNHTTIDQLQDGFWDASVYKESEQLLATIYGHKGTADLRPLLPEAAAGHQGANRGGIANYVAQVTSPQWLLLGTYSLQANQADKRDPKQRLTTHTTVAARGRAAAGSDAAGFNRVDLSEVEHLTRPLASDAGLHQLFDNTSFNGLRFQYAHKSPDGAVVSLYIKHSTHQMCPIAGRVHQSNNATLIVNRIRLRLSFRCFDEDCLAGGSQCNGVVDLTAHLQPVTMQALFGASGEHSNDHNKGADKTEEAVAFTDDDNEHGASMMQVLTCFIRKSGAFAGVPEGCKLVLTQPQTLPAGGGGGGGGSTQVTVRFRLGNRVGTLTQNTSVLDGSGNFVDQLVKDQLVPGPLSHIEGALPADASFTFNQISAKDGQLKSLEPHPGYCLTLYNMYDSSKNTVALQVPRKVAKNITQRAKVKELMQAVQHASAAHVSRVLGDQFMPIVFNVQQNYQLINNGTINHHNNNGITTAAPPEPDDKFSVIIGKLDTASQDGRLRKLDGDIYEPLPGAPCAYVKKWTYKDYINSVLKDDPAYRSSAWRHKEAMEYLDKFDNDFLPVLKPDRDLLSFANGVLELSTAAFLAHDDPALHGRVARHHISMQFTGTEETPLLDLVLDAQFDREVADILCGMLGRLLFNIGQLDDWQVMPYLVGIGGTGKSLLLGIAESFFNEEMVGEIAAQSEEVFGLDNLADKEVVIGRDMPEKLSRALKQEHMQSMTSGERLSVAIKGKKAKHMRWTAPVIMASNHDPDYKNSGGQVSRRMVTFRFEQVVENARSGLARDILSQELPAVIARCLASYHRLREQVKAGAGGFWAAMPATIQSWQNRLSAATNKLHEFLEMDDDDRGCKIELVPGKVTWVSDFKEAYEAHMDDKLDPYKQPHVFQKFGFKIHTDPKLRENVCKWCKQLAKGRGEKCCIQYNNTARLPKAVIYDMNLKTCHSGTDPVDSRRMDGRCL